MTSGSEGRVEELLRSVKTLSELHAEGKLFEREEDGGPSKAEQLAFLRAKRAEIQRLLSAVHAKETIDLPTSPPIVAQLSASSIDDECIYENTAALVGLPPPPPPREGKIFQSLLSMAK